MDGNIFAPWIGRTLNNVERDEHSWGFDFGAAGGLTVQTLWRLCVGDRVLVGSEDHNQRFGLPAPIDAVQACRDALLSATMTRVDLNSVADLKIAFSENATIEIWNNSAGYEPWQAVVADGTHRVNVIGLGGGGIAMHDAPAEE